MHWFENGLLPPHRVIACFSDYQEPATPLYEVERAYISGSSKARLREFSVGRACARRGLVLLGRAAGAIPSDGYRAPVWPHGIVGSISHCRGLCGAAVGQRNEALNSIGMDIEERRAVSPDLADIICLPEERAWLSSFSSVQSRDALTAIFSAKEAFYKCIHPVTGLIFGFDAVLIDVDFSGGRFRATLQTPLPPLPATYRMTGEIRLSDDHVITAITLPAPHPGLADRPKSSCEKSLASGMTEKA